MMLEVPLTTKPYEAVKREQDVMSSRLLLLRLRRLHYEHAPKEYKDQFLPVVFQEPCIKPTKPTPPKKREPEMPSLNFDGFQIPPATPLRTVLRAVSHYYRIAEWRILGGRRTDELVKPRHIALYLACELADTSLAQIGRFFNRDHTVVLHARTKITLQMQTDEVLALQVTTIKRQIAALGPDVDHVKRMRDKASASHAKRFKHLQEVAP